MQTLSRVEDLVAACDERQIGDKLRVNKSLPGPLTTSVKTKIWWLLLVYQQAHVFIYFQPCGLTSACFVKDWLWCLCRWLWNVEAWYEMFMSHCKKSMSSVPSNGRMSSSNLVILYIRVQEWLHPTPMFLKLHCQLLLTMLLYCGGFC
jgi:hypothetical protein